MTIRSTLILALLALVAAGCGEKPQTASASKKADAKPWDTPAGAYAAPDWKGGDQAAWDAQLRSRAQGQNEYSRSAAAAPAVAASKSP
jgi:hypothetical protein